MEFWNVMCFFLGFILSGLSHYLAFALGYRWGFGVGVGKCMSIIDDKVSEIKEKNE